MKLSTILSGTVTLLGMCTMKAEVLGDPGGRYSVREGGSVQVHCVFNTSGTRKMFCRRDQVAEDRGDQVAEDSCGQVLVETSSHHKNSDRYSMKYKKEPKSSYFLNVTITDVRTEDYGRYLCALEKGGRLESVPVFIQVLPAEASTDSGLTSPRSRPPHQNQTPPLYAVVGLSFAAAIVFSVTSSVLCSRRRIGCSTEAAEAADPEMSECRVYEEIPCDGGQSTAPPAASAGNSTSSLCSAPSAAPQVMCATVSNSQVDLSSCSSAPRCPPEDHVLYSTVSLPAAHNL